LIDNGAVVTATAGEDSARLATAYGKYAAALYDYCLWRQPDPLLAAHALRAAFAAVAGCSPGWPFPDELRSHLYAAARAACQRPASAAGAHAGEVAGQGADSTELAQARRLARAVLADLDPLEQEVVELRFRHRLAAIETADVLQLAPGQVPDLTESARRYLEEVLGALVLVRAGPPDCPRLASLLASRSEPLTAATGKLAARHIGHCRTCAGHRPGELRPDQLLGLLPLAELPDELRELALPQVATDQDEEQLASPGSSGGPDGPPRPGGSGRAGGSRRRDGIRVSPAAATAVAAATVGVAAAVTAVVMTASGAGATHAPAVQAAHGGPAASGSLAGGALATGRASQPSAASPSPSRSPSRKPAHRSAAASIVSLAAAPPVSEATLEPSYPVVTGARVSVVPSASRSASPSPSPTRRRPVSPAPTGSSSASPSGSPPASGTGSPSASPAPSGSSSPSPTASVTASPSASRR
jgi:DNA-directed RNA polymerase specialized sigma24 family protein